MRTPTSYSNTLAALIRQHFALTQAELADWLRLTMRQVEAVEAGRRQFSPVVREQLGRLARLLPPTGPALPDAEALPAPPFRPAQGAKEAGEANLLRRRVRRCQHLAGQLAFQLDTLAQQDAALRRRRQGLAALRLALATPPTTPAPDYDPDFEVAWLTHLEYTTKNLSPRPGPLARAHLELRQRLLLEEAQELTRLLEAGNATLADIT